MEGHGPTVPQLEGDRPGLQIDRGDTSLLTLGDAVDSGMPREGQVIPQLVAPCVLLLGLGEPTGDPDGGLVALLLNLARLDQRLPDPPVQVVALLIAGGDDGTTLPPGGAHEVLGYRLVPVGASPQFHHLALRLQPAHRGPGPAFGSIDHGGPELHVLLAPNLIQAHRPKPRSLQVGEGLSRLHGGMLQAVPYQHFGTAEN